METRINIAQIEMAHGAGGKATRRLIEGIILPAFANPVLEALSDSALVTVDGKRLALTADGFVVKPLRFPGGSIGSLAVHGTVNDLAVAGARPLALLATFILEAGLEGEVLEREVAAMAEAARSCGVHVVGGDTKVVEHGMADGMYVSTFGLGCVDERLTLGPQQARVGDAVLLSGPIGEHGITILLARGELELEADIASDTRSLVPFVNALCEAAAPAIRWMRDPTRGGVATALNELARDARLGVILEEAAVPLSDCVRGACEILGPGSPAHRQRRPAAGGGRARIRPRGAASNARGRGRPRIGNRRRTRSRAEGARRFAHLVWRNARRRHVGRRSASAHLLKSSPALGSANELGCATVSSSATRTAHLSLRTKRCRSRARQARWRYVFRRAGDYWPSVGVPTRPTRCIFRSNSFIPFW